MAKIPNLILGFFCFINAFSQENEFPIYPNGLIYSEATMTKLSHIVDSLNLRYKTCDLNKVFYSNKQTVGHLVRLSKGDLKAAKEDMDKGISPEDFLVRYPMATIERQVLITKTQYKDYDDKEVILIRHFDLHSDYGFSITKNDLSLHTREMKNTWLYEYNKSSRKSEGFLYAFYFPNSFTSIQLPGRYSQMIGYADCLIDTTTTKLKAEIESDWGWEGLPENWQSLSEEKKDELLDKMRSTRVMGLCSQDSRPRTHAVNIALLSAETAKWEVFLKAHLDIMNDRFERMSDGNYAWAKRNTYIKELEELNIDVSDLILGILFRIENPSENHYYGSISRVGRALSETTNKEEIEDVILKTIADPELDDYNRILFYFLFLNYSGWLQDADAKKQSEEKLNMVVQTLPNYLREKIKKQ